MLTETKFRFFSELKTNKSVSECTNHCALIFYRIEIMENGWLANRRQKNVLSGLCVIYIFAFSSKFAGHCLSFNVSKRSKWAEIEKNATRQMRHLLNNIWMWPNEFRDRRRLLTWAFSISYDMWYLLVVLGLVWCIQR